MIRRDFLGGLMAALAGGAALGASTEGNGTPERDWAAWLASAIARHGDDVVSREVVALTDAGQFTLPALRQRLRRLERAGRKAARREAHAGDVQLYSGPVYVGAADWSRLVNREVKTSYQRTVTIGTLDHAWYIRGVAGPKPAGLPPEEEVRQPAAWVPEEYQGGKPSDCTPERRRPVVTLLVPAGSRVLMDLRRLPAQYATCELVRTANGRHRIHMWGRQQEWVPTDVVPVLTDTEAGRSYEPPSQQRTIGLLGLPL